MLKNHIRIIFRSLKKAPLYFFINLFGLSVGMASCIILLQYAYFESSYDSFHENAEKKYRLVVKDNGGIGAKTPIPVGNLISEEFNEIKNYVALRRSDGVVKTSKENRNVSDIEEKVVMSTPDFFDMFSFKLLSGNREDLNNPNNVFISESIAEKYFESTNVLGQDLLFFDRNFGELKLKVSGVMQDPPPNTHLPVRMVMSLNTIAENDQFWAKFDNWGWNDFYTYIQITTTSQLAQTELNAFLDRHIGAENRERAGIELQTQPIQSIHLESDIMYSYEPVRDVRINTFLKIIGVFILFMACINYVNLAGANGLKRAKEVGVRKNMGANRKDVIGQFSLESLVINTLSLSVAFTIIQLIWPFLSDTIGGAFTINFWEASNLYFILIPILVGIVWTVFQPAFVMSSFQVIDVLKGNISNHGSGKRYRKGSIIIQFVVSLTLMITSYVIYSQISYLQNKELGINIERKLIVKKAQENVRDYETKSETFKESLKSLSFVDNVSYSGSVPTKGYNYSTNSLHRSDREPNEVGEYGINITYIDNEFTQIYNPKLLAGKSQNMGKSDELKVLINDKALIPLFIESPEEAIGMNITNGEEEMEIIGVIDSYQHNSVKEESRPVLYMFDKNPQYFTISFNGGEEVVENTSRVLSATKEQYAQLFPDTNFDYTFLDQEFEKQYRFEKFFGNVVLSFTGLAILLAVTGLFGLSMFDMERKTKEVGIRKTLGATAMSLFTQNIKPFTKLLLFACLLALPIAYFLSLNWLADYTFKVQLQVFTFVLPVIGLFIVTLITVSYHLIKLNNTNPVDSLRNE